MNRNCLLVLWVTPKGSSTFPTFLTAKREWSSFSDDAQLFTRDAARMICATYASTYPAGDVEVYADWGLETETREVAS